MSLGVKVHRYQSWYGERCPYTKPAMKIKEEREFIPSISKPIVPPQSHQEIILGPKRERPHSAVRPSHSSSKPSVMPVRPTSGLRSRQSSGPERHQRHQDRDLKKNLSEGKILKISPALGKMERIAKGNKTLGTPDLCPVLSKPPGVSSVRDIDVITQRKIVPNVEKNYLKQRSVSPKQIDALPSTEIAVGDTPPPPSPHPELVKRSLFVSGLRNHVKQAEATDSSSAPTPSDLIIQNSFPTDPQKLTSFERKLNQISQSTPASRPRAQTTIVTSTQSDFQVSARPNSSHRATVRSSFKSEKSSDQKQELIPFIRPISPRKPTGTPRSLALSSPKKKSPTESDDQGDEDSAGDDDPCSTRDENLTYALFSIVEARYKGRSHWWTGKIVQTRLDGTYDIQFGDILERHVPASLIRPKPSVDLDSMKRKIRMTGMLASTLRESFESIQRSDSETEAMDDEPNAMPVDALLHRTSSSSSTGTSASSPNGRALVRKTIVRVLSIGGSLPPVEEDPSATRKKLFSQIASNAHKLKKVDYQMEAAAEAVAEANRRHEKSEQLRLWPEIKSVVTKSHLEIAFDDIKVLSKIGEGKFASVHSAELSVKLHNKVFAGREGVKRTLERLGNNLNQIHFGMKNLSLPCALKVLEYMDAYPLVGGDWENDRPPEKDYCNDQKLYTDEFEVTEMEREELEGKRQRADSLADDPHGDPNRQHLQLTQSFQDRYRTMPPSKSILESLREIRALSLLQHQNIVMLHGVVLVPRLILVMERMQYNLGDLLSTPSDRLQIQLTPSQRLTLLHDISHGMMYIHGNCYIHRDIKTHNVLVTSGVGGYVAKIADFGTALHISKGRKLTEPVGTLGYTAPEVIDQHPSYDTSADIFSMAVLMWDTLQPQDQRVENPLTCLSPEETPEKMYQGVRPPLSHCLLPKIHPLIEKCWATLPTSRESAETLYHELTQHVAST